MNIFFSHSNTDSPLVEELVEILKDNEATINAFYSSKPETGILAGHGITDGINQALVQCQYFVPIITENYVRSQYCMYELSVASFLRAHKRLEIIPIVTNETIYKQINTILTQFDLLFIDASGTNPAELLFEAFKGINKKRFSQTVQLMQKLSLQTHSLNSYIGMSQDSYENILGYCQKYGIKQFKNATLSGDFLHQKIKHAKEVLILSTTGASLLKSLCEKALPEALSNGCKVSVMLPNQYSDFCKDVAQIERPDAAKDNIIRLAQEYTSVIGFLKDAVKSADNHRGSITCYCSHTLLRQTILLVRNVDDSLWGWVSMTLPPKRTINDTPSFEVEGKLEKGNFVYLLWQHCQEIIQFSKQKRTWFDINPATDGPFYLERDTARKYWKEKYTIAKTNMEDCYRQYDCALIEVAAQHPLKRGNQPGPEFSRRLDMALKIHEQLKQENIDSYFYIPGSRHRHKGTNDLISLSAAGAQYLLEKGVAPELIYGEEMNQKYKGADGVYNSADECYVASSIFHDGNFDQLICVCSPNQVMRKTLFYIEFGICPQCYSVPAERMFHNVLDELFDSLEKVIYQDHSWQDPNSETFQYYRQERMPLDNTFAE